MPGRTQTRLRTLALFAMPVTLRVAFIPHPYLANERDISQFVAAAVANPNHWAWAHVMWTVARLMVRGAFAL